MPRAGCSSRACRRTRLRAGRRPTRSRHARPPRRLRQLRVAASTTAMSSGSWCSQAGCVIAIAIDMRIPSLQTAVNLYLRALTGRLGSRFVPGQAPQSPRLAAWARRAALSRSSAYCPCLPRKKYGAAAPLLDELKIEIPRAVRDVGEEAAVLVLRVERPIGPDRDAGTDGRESRQRVQCLLRVALARRQLGGVDLHQADATVVGEPERVAVGDARDDAGGQHVCAARVERGGGLRLRQRPPDEEDSGSDGDQDSWQPRAHVNAPRPTVAGRARRRRGGSLRRRRTARAAAAPCVGRRRADRGTGRA